MRLFAALQPPPTVLEHVETALRSVRGPMDPGDSRGPLRWTSPDDRHLTLAFYGEVPDGSLPEVCRRLEALASRQAPFELHLKGAGVFDRRVVWVGCGGDTTALARLAAEAVEAGREIWGRQDDRVRSRGHLTVARTSARGRARAAEVSALAHALAVYRGPSWLVEDLAIVSSHLGGGPAGHPVHEVVERFPLLPVAG